MAFELPACRTRGHYSPIYQPKPWNFTAANTTKTYVDKLNGLVDGTDLAGKSLEEVVLSIPGPVFNRPGWNHTFYWLSQPQWRWRGEGRRIKGHRLRLRLIRRVQEQFTNSAVNNFGSGWTWLVKGADGKLAIVNTGNAATPLTDKGVVPLLTVDVGSTPTIDYRNARPKYMDAFWALVNWDFVNANLA